MGILAVLLILSLAVLLIVIGEQEAKELDEYVKKRAEAYEESEK
jgi:hypothetical protein